MLKNIDGIFWNGSLASCQAFALQGADSDLHHETLRRCVAGFIHVSDDLLMKVLPGSSEKISEQFGPNMETQLSDQQGQSGK